MPNIKDKFKYYRSLFNDRVLILLFFLVIGFSLILIGTIIPNEYEVIKPLVEKMGDAIFIASCLGLTIEWWMIKEIAGDVFKASIGYIFPNELKNELRWLYGQEFISEDHVHTVKIEKIPNTNFVVVTTSMVRITKNISQNKLSLPFFVSVDEWGIEGYKSEILRCGYQYKDKLPIEDYTLITNPQNIKATFEPIQLYPKESVKTWWTIKEIKHINDHITCVFKYPIHKPIMMVHGPADELNWQAGFGHREPVEIDSGTGTWKLPETLLPNQQLWVRWWPRNKI